MTRLRACIVFVSICAALFCGKALPSDFSAQAKIAEKSIVSILDGDQLVGTGFFVRSSLLVTNLHVVAEASNIRIRLPNTDLRSDFHVVAYDPKQDLVVLRITSNAPALKAAAKVPSPGAEIIALGNPRGLEMSLTKGTVSAIRRDDEGRVLIQTDAAVNPGNSGGPLLDKSTKVIGVVTSRLAQAEGIAFAVPIGMVNDLIDKTLRDRPMSFGEFQERLWSDERHLFGAIKQLGMKWKDDTKTRGIWTVLPSGKDKLQVRQEFDDSDRDAGISINFELDRIKGLLYGGVGNMKITCLLPDLTEKSCSFSVPAVTKIMSTSSIHLAIQMGKPNCETCSFEGVQAKTTSLTPASVDEKPQRLGLMDALQKARSARNAAERERREREQREVERRQRQRELEERRSAENFCALAIANAKAACDSNSMFCLANQMEANKACARLLNR